MPTNAIAQRCRFVSPAEHMWNRVQIIGNSTTFQPECRELGRELQKSYPFAWEVVWKSAKSIWLGEVWTHAVSVALLARQTARISQTFQKLGRFGIIFSQKSLFAQKFRFQLILSVFLKQTSHVDCVGLHVIFGTCFGVFNWFLAYFLLQNIGFFLNKFVGTDRMTFSGPVLKISTDS